MPTAGRSLARHALGRVAIVHLGLPAIFPLSFVLDGPTVVFRTAPGTTLAMARAGDGVHPAQKLHHHCHGAIVDGPDLVGTDRRSPSRSRSVLSAGPFGPAQRDPSVRTIATCVRRSLHQRSDDSAACCCTAPTWS